MRLSHTDRPDDAVEPPFVDMSDPPPPAPGWLEAVPQMACLSDRSGKLIAANRRWHAFWKAQSQTWRSHVHPDDEEALDELMSRRGAAAGELRECRLMAPGADWQCFAIGVSELGDGDVADTLLITAFPVDGYLRRLADLQGRDDLLGKMLDTSIDCIKILSPSGQLRHMNLAGCHALGVSPGHGFGMTWLALLPEEVRPAGAAALDVARAGETARFPGKSELPGMAPQFWDNMLTPLIGADGKVSDIVCVSRDVTEQRLHELDLVRTKARLQSTADEFQAALMAREVLAGEMMHRIKNLFAVVTGLIAMAKRQAGTTDSATEVLGNVKQRIFALARATELLMQRDQARVDTDFDPLAVCGAVLAPYKGQVTQEGASAAMQQNVLNSLVLLIHELATNSLKHGALGAEGGKLHLRWSETAAAILLDWRESGCPGITADPEGEGFGTSLVRNVVEMSGWTMTRRWSPDGLHVEVMMPKIAFPPE
ncbi:MAG: PAS domain-containing protein [Paracoccaceae bacterium]